MHFKIVATGDEQACLDLPRPVRTTEEKELFARLMEREDLTYADGNQPQGQGDADSLVGGAPLPVFQSHNDRFTSQTKQVFF